MAIVCAIAEKYSQPPRGVGNTHNERNGSSVLIATLYFVPAGCGNDAASREFVDVGRAREGLARAMARSSVGT